MIQLTRVFFVTDSVDDDSELFETLEGAMAHISSISKKCYPRIRIMMVKNAYKDMGEWNYDDRSDTFETVKTLKVK